MDIAKLKQANHLDDVITKCNNAISSIEASERNQHVMITINIPNIKELNGIIKQAIMGYRDGKQEEFNNL